VDNALPTWITIGDRVVTIEIVARPGASRRRIIRDDPRGLVIALTSAPEKGKANDELVQFLATALKVARTTIAIARGTTSRRKTIRIGPCDASAVATSLAILANPEM
jgi:uncharacterized protein